MPEESRNNRGVRVTQQSVTKMAAKVAEEILNNPEKHQGNDPAVIHAIESVLELLQQKATAGTELSKILDMANVAIEEVKMSDNKKRNVE